MIKEIEQDSEDGATVTIQPVTSRGAEGDPYQLAAPAFCSGEKWAKTRNAVHKLIRPLLDERAFSRQELSTTRLP